MNKEDRARLRLYGAAVGYARSAIGATGFEAMVSACAELEEAAIEFARVSTVPAPAAEREG